MNIAIKTIYLFIMKTSILVGGQAVIEGVMMRVPGAYATALRLKNGKKRSHRKIRSTQRQLKRYSLLYPGLTEKK